MVSPCGFPQNGGSSIIPLDVESAKCRITIDAGTTTLKPENTTMQEITFHRGQFTNPADGSGDSYFDELLDELGIPRDDEIEEVNLEVAAHTFN